MSSSQRFRVLTLLSCPDMENAALRYGGAIARARRARMDVLRAPSTIGAGSSHHYSPFPAEVLGEGDTMAEAARNFSRNADIGMIISDWCRDRDQLQDILRLVVERNAAGVIVRQKSDAQAQRVLVPTGGGPHTLEQMWIARELSSVCEAPIHVLRILPQGDGAFDAENEEALEHETKLARIQAKMAGINEPVEVVVAPDVVTGIEQNSQQGDLIMLGAPNYWRVADHFTDSIPDQVAQRTPHSLVMLLTRRAERISLRELFWERMIRLDLRPDNKSEVIEHLVDVLVRENQVPAMWRDYILDTALNREAIMSTAVGCETAFPHVALPDFTGIIGCMGICPEGVSFGNDEDQPTKFVFLLVTPREFYDEYLQVLAKLAGMMVSPDVRRELEKCTDRSQVLEILDRASPE